jgi:hypothetical protein
VDVGRERGHLFRPARQPQANAATGERSAKSNAFWYTLRFWNMKGNRRDPAVNS